MSKPTRQPQQWILVTGLSGSGKTTALKVLEDEGFFSVDNLPPALLSPLIALLKSSENRLSKVALGMDAREKNFLESYPEILDAFYKAGLKPDIWFFESKPEVLIRRYSESRRPHPLGKRGSLEKAIDKERRLLAPLREISTTAFDTTHLNIHDLQHLLREKLRTARHSPHFSVHLQSFGFKYGLPAEADLVFDVRFLQNPYFIPALKKLDGHSRRVQKFILEQEDAQLFLQHLLRMLRFLLPLYKKEGKTRLTVSIGCTGGRHRSPVFVEALAKKLKNRAWELTAAHRDIGKG